MTGAAVTAGFLTAATLVLPWFNVSGQARSSIDLISSAGALEIIEGGTRLLVVALWLGLPVLAAVSLFAFAARRFTLAAYLTFVVGLLVLGVVIVGGVVDVIGLAWGAWLAAFFGLAAGLSSVAALALARGSK